MKHEAVTMVAANREGQWAYRESQRSVCADLHLLAIRTVLQAVKGINSAKMLSEHKHHLVPLIESK